MELTEPFSRLSLLSIIKHNGSWKKRTANKNFVLFSQECTMKNMDSTCIMKQNIHFDTTEGMHVRFFNFFIAPVPGLVSHLWFDRTDRPNQKPRHENQQPRFQQLFSLRRPRTNTGMSRYCLFHSCTKPHHDLMLSSCE